MAKQKVFEVVAEGQGDRARRVYRVGVDDEDAARDFVNRHEQGLVAAKQDVQAQVRELKGSGPELGDLRTALDVQAHGLRSVQEQPYKIKSIKPVED